MISPNRKWTGCYYQLVGWARNKALDRESALKLMPAVIDPFSMYHEPRMQGMAGLTTDRYPIQEKVRMQHIALSLKAWLLAEPFMISKLAPRRPQDAQVSRA